MSSRQINKLTSNSNFSSRKVLNSSHKSFNDLGKEPNQRKDLFRAYLDVRQHSTPFEEDKANYLSIVSETPAKCHQIYEQSTEEYFSGGHRGIYAAQPTFKMNPRQTREINKNVTNNFSLFPKDIPHSEEVVPQKVDAKPFSCNEESRVEIKTIRIPQLDDDNKENIADPHAYYTMSEKESERKHFPCPNTFENVFGGRYDKDLKNETQNNHIDYDKMQVINLDDDNPEKCESRGLYRMANGPTRCAMWRQENERSRRVMHWAESLHENTNYEKLNKSESLENLTKAQSGLSNDHPNFRIEDAKIVQVKPVRNTVLSNLDDSKSISIKTSSATLNNDSFDPFDTKSWFKNKKAQAECPKKPSFKSITPIVRSVINDMVVPSSDPLFVVNYEDFNEIVPNKPEPTPRVEQTRSSINAPILKKQSNKPKPNQNKGLVRSECNWFREKHVYNKDRKATFKPECRYNFSCTTSNAPKPS